MKKKILFLSCIALSLLSSFTLPPELLHQYTVRLKSGFGNSDTPVELYIFTDFKYPISDDEESTLCKIAEEASKKARLFFIDKNLSADGRKVMLEIVLHNKKELQKYLQARSIIHKTLLATPDTTIETLRELLKPLTIDTISISDADEKAAFDLTESMYNQLSIKKSPTIMIFNIVKSTQYKTETITKEQVPEILATLDTL